MKFKYLGQRKQPSMRSWTKNYLAAIFHFSFSNNWLMNALGLEIKWSNRIVRSYFCLSLHRIINHRSTIITASSAMCAVCPSFQCLKIVDITYCTFRWVIASQGSWPKAWQNVWEWWADADAELNISGWVSAIELIWRAHGPCDDWSIECD